MYFRKKPSTSLRDIPLGTGIYVVEQTNIMDLPSISVSSFIMIIAAFLSLYMSIRLYKDRGDADRNTSMAIISLSLAFLWLYMSDIVEGFVMMNYIILFTSFIIAISGAYHFLNPSVFST